MGIKLHFDGHGLNDESGQRVYTLQRKHADDGGGYVLDRDKARELSDFIVRACNSHYELVEALELVLLTVDFSGSTMEKSIRSVLAKAKVE